MFVHWGQGSKMSVTAIKKSLLLLLCWSALATVFVLSPLLCSAGEAGKVAYDLLQMPAFHLKTPEKGKLLDVARAGTRMVAVGENGLIIGSDDSGKTWFQGSVPMSVTLTALCFPSPLVGWAVGHDGIILHTSDGGATWIRQIDGSQINRGAYEQVEKLYGEKTSPPSSSPTVQFDEYDWMNLEVYLRDIEQMKKEGSVWPFLDVWFADDQKGFAVGAFGMAVRTSDGGKTWNPFMNRLPNPKGLHYYAVAKVGSDLFIAGEEGQVLRSEDDGQNWKQLDSPYDGSFFGIMGTHSGDDVIAFGLRGHGFISRDRGDTWEPLKLPEGGPWMSGMVLNDGSVLLISPVLGGYISTDNGLSFAGVPGFPMAAVAAMGTPGNGLLTVGVLGTQIVQAGGILSNKVVQGAKK